MTVDIAIVLSILLVALILFITEKVRMDVTALLVLVSLALTGVLEPSEAISGFSNPAVITVWAMFILSEGLANTGVANIIGRYVLHHHAYFGLPLSRHEQHWRGRVDASRCFKSRSRNQH